MSSPESAGNLFNVTMSSPLFHTVCAEATGGAAEYQAAGEREVAKRHTTRQHAVCLTFEPAEEGHVKQAVHGSLFGLGRTRTINKKKTRGLEKR